MGFTYYSPYQKIVSKWRKAPDNQAAEPVEEIGIFASTVVLPPLEPASQGRRELPRWTSELGRAQSKQRLALAATVTEQS